MGSVDIHYASRAEKKQVIDLFCRAFNEDPMYAWLLRQDHKRKLAYKTLFRLSVENYAQKAGELWVAGDVDAAALWVPDPHWKLGLFQELLQLTDGVRMFSAKGLARGIWFLKQQQAFHPKVPHQYLMWLAVKPEKQNKGLGTALMNHSLRRCDQRAEASYVEITQGYNIKFYRRFGFEIMHSIPLGIAAPPYWGLWRSKTAE